MANRRRHAASIGAVTLALLFSVSANSVAASNKSASGTGTPTPAVVDQSGALDDPASEAARQLAERYGLSIAEASGIIQKTPRVDSLEAEMTKRGSPGFVGVWIDWEAHGTVHVTSDSKADLVLAQEEANTLGLEIETGLVSRGGEALRVIQRRLDAGHDPDLEKLPIASAIDITNDTVVAEVRPESAENARANLRAAGRQDIDVQESRGATAAACTSRTACGSPLRAGICIGLGAACGQSQLFCTSGVQAWYSDGSRWLLTSGHCGGVTTSTNWVHGQQFLGPIRQHVFSGSVDAARIRIDNSYWLPIDRTWLYLSTTTPYIMQGINSSPVVGSAICHSGASSGYRCGTVYTRTYTATYNDFDGTSRTITNQLLSHDMCGMGGDSGGPIIDPSTYSGIAQFNFTWNGACTGGGGGGSFYSNIDAAMPTTIFS
jgi:streptogrisin C